VVEVVEEDVELVLVDPAGGAMSKVTLGADWASEVAANSCIGFSL
jgi:hypothetical protein